MKRYYELNGGTVIEADGNHWDNDPTAKRLSNAEGARRLKAQAIAELRKLLKPGDTVYTKVSHVARSGMSRRIEVFVIRDNEPRAIGWSVGHALDRRVDRSDLSVQIGGCGMDMGFALVYELSRTLFPDGFGCTGEQGRGSARRCPSNDHSNGDRDYTPHSGEPFTNDPNARYVHLHWHRDGGYALRQAWL